MHDLLARTSERIGPAPRRIDAWSRLRMAASRPAWLGPLDPLWRAEAERPVLLRRGRLVKSWVVMANEFLFTPGERPSPALVVYAPHDDADGEALESVTATVLGLRRAKPVDADLAALAADVFDPKARPMARPVPPSLAEGRTLRIATVLVYRSHLPRPYLAASLLPLLVLDETPSVIVLPSQLWADDLVAAWLDLAAA
jgi:hypothetical protein